MRAQYPIRVSAIFAHPEAAFSVPFQVPKEMMNLLSSEVVDSEAFDKAFGPDYYLCFMYSSDPGMTDLAIKGPVISKRYRAVEYVLSMPHFEITPGPAGLDRFLHYMERGATTVLEKHKIRLARPVAAIFVDLRKKFLS